MAIEIKPEQVPKIVVEAAVSTWLNSDGTARQDITKVIAAALSAWPGVKFEHLSGWVMDGPDLPYVEETASIILPIPTQENGDE